MKTSTIPMDTAGRIVLPKSTRLNFKLSGGAHFEVHERAGEIVLKPVGTLSGLVRKHGWLVWSTPASLSIDEVEDAIQRGRSERDNRASGLHE